MMASKILGFLLIFVFLFDLHQCQPELAHPKGYERCFRKFMGEPWTLEYLCCVEDPETCFAGYLEEACIIRCPPLRKGKAKPSPPPRKGKAKHSPPPRKGKAKPSPPPSP